MAKHVAVIGNEKIHLDLGSEDIGTFQLTPERLREIAREQMITSGPGSSEMWMPTSDELGHIVDMVNSAVNSGQVIDFGYWPNEVIQMTSNRGGYLYVRDALGHPFSSPYVILHSWDDKKNEKAERQVASIQGRKKPIPETTAYLVNPFPTDKVMCSDFEILAFDAMTIKGERMLAVGDRGLFLGEESRGKKEYCARVIPYAYRFPELIGDKEFARMVTNSRSDSIMEAAAANILDPLMTALLILNTNGIGQSTVTHDKLNKVRAKQGKPHIPSYRRVDSASYVTAILAKKHRERNDLGGHHASPVMHIRQGHWRNYKSGEKSFIRDTLVNATPELRDKFVSQRSHYVVKK
jgi:hypothetical protein